MNQDFFAIAEEPISYIGLSTPVMVSEECLDDDNAVVFQGGKVAASEPFYQLSKEYTSEVTFYNASENQTVTATVNLGVTLSLNLNVSANETIWSNICYSGSWSYATNVSIDWGEDCPWNSAERARQKKQVEDSIYVESLNVKCDNSKGIKNVCHYDKNDHTFMVEFEEGLNTLEGSIVVASDYLPQYTVEIENVQNSAAGPSGKTTAEDTASISKNAQKKQSKAKIQSLSIKTDSIMPNVFNYIICNAVLTVDIPPVGDFDVYTVSFTLSAKGKSKTITDTLTVSNGGWDLKDDYFSLESVKISDTEKRITINTLNYQTKPSFYSLSYETGTQEFSLYVSVKQGEDKKTTHTITVEDYQDSCWANVFLKAFDLDINSNNLGRLFSNLEAGQGANPVGYIDKALKMANFPPDKDVNLTAEKIVEAFKLNKVFLRYNGFLGSGLGSGHVILVTNIEKKTERQTINGKDSIIEKYYVTCYDTSNGSGGWTHTYKLENSYGGGVWLDYTKYTTMYSIPKSSSLSQTQFEQIFKLKTELVIETMRNAPANQLLGNLHRTGPVYSHTFTDTDYSDLYISNMNVAFGEKATLSYAWLRNGTTVGVLDGATISDSWVQDGSSLFIYSGAELSGTLTVSGLLTVEGPITINDAEIELDISSLDGGGDNNVLVNGINYLGSALWTILIADNQNAGTYLLADNASSFNSTISIDYSGTVNVGETLTLGLANYTLNLSATGLLTLTITYDEPEDGIAPTTPNITEVLSASSNVTINWEASTDHNGIYQYVLFYSLNESFWEADYVCTTDLSATISGLQDGVYYMRVCAVDTYGNVSEYSETQRVQVGPPEISVSLNDSDIFLNRYQSEQRNYVFTSEIRNDSDIDIDDLYVKVMISEDEFYGSDDYMLAGLSLGQLKAGESVTALLKFNIPEQYLTGDYYIGIVSDDYTEAYQFQVEDWFSFNGEDELEYYGTDVLLPNIMPQAEYMYGCTPTALGMLLGYYDLYGYNDKDLSNLIEGDVDIYSRGTDGNIYNMNAFDTVLGKFIASEDYVYRFFSREDLSVITATACSTNYKETTPAEELPYSFVNSGSTLNTSVWNCLADYIGTGQYWRGQGNLSTAMSYNSLEGILKSTSTTTFTGDGYSRTIDYKYTTLLYGLNLYVQSRGYELNPESTGTYTTDNNGGDFTFEDYMREIDAGRPVLISITDHSMVGYGYNAKTKEIIFDDDYASDQRMVWGESYFYSGKNRDLQSITVLSFRTQPGNRDLTFDGVVKLANQASANDSSIYFFDGEPIYLSFNAKNAGSSPCYSFKITVKVDGAAYEVLDITKLAGNEIRQFKDLKLEGLAAGTHQVEVILDSADTVEESSSSNNRYSQTIQVLPEGMQILSSRATVSTGQTASNTLVVAAGSMAVGSMTLDGGYAENIYLQGCSTSSNYGYAGVLIAKNGGRAKQVEAFDWGRIYVSSGGRIESARLHSNGGATVSSGGSVAGLTIESGGYAYNSCGDISGLAIESGGYAYNYGGDISNATLDGSLYFRGSQGGMLSSATVNAYLSMQATGGAVASNIVLGSKGNAYIYSSSLLQGVTGNGFIYAAQGGIVRKATILAGGSVGVGEKGRTSNVVLNSRTLQYVYSGGTAFRTSAMGGMVYVYSGGVVSSAIIGNSASMKLLEGGKAYNLAVDQGGLVSGYGYLYGNLTIGGRVQNATGVGFGGVSSYLFNVQTQMDDAFLSFDDGGIAANSSITIDVSNAWGDYTLVKGDLTNLSTATITAQSGDYSSAVAANGKVTLGDGRTVKLTKGTDAWTLTVSGKDNTPPATPTKLVSNLIDNVLHVSWQAVQDFSGVKYEVEYSRNADFSDSVSRIATTSSIELPLANGAWHWRMRSVDGAGNVSPWTNESTVEVDYTKVLAGKYAQTQSLYSDVTLAKGVSVTASFPGGVQLLDNGFHVTLMGNNTVTCTSIRNAAILFGEDASWGDYYDGTVTFAGTNITLHSEVSNCITAAGIRGNNLTVNFAEDASGAESIVFEASNGTSGPGNYAAGVQAAGDLVVNGDFGGTISCVMDCRELTSVRWGYMEGFYALGNLEFNGDMDGNIYLAGYGTSGSYAYGLYSGQNLAVNGNIGGIIMATAENNSYGLYGSSSITASISGIVFAGTTTEANDQDTLAEKLKHFSENKEELLMLSQGKYSIYTSGKADITLSDNALLLGKLYLGSGSQITVFDGASIYGDITTYYSTGMQFVLNDASLEGTRLSMSNWNNNLTLSVKADGIDTDGTYSLVEAANLSSVSNVTLSVGGKTYNLQTGNSVTVGGIKYTLTNTKTSSRHTLALTVSGSILKDREAPVLAGQVQATQEADRKATLVWEAATDNVGVAGYEVKWDGAVTSTIRPTKVLENITLGTHTCQIRAFDAAGNYSEWSSKQDVVFSDTSAPVMKSISTTPSSATNQDVTITVEYDDDFGDCHIQYRLPNNSIWQNYNGSVVVSSNTVISFRATDDSGNISDVTQFPITKIDKVKPVISDITANVTKPTKGNVIVTASASDDVSNVSLFYSLNGGKFLVYPTSGVTFTSNGKVTFKAVDAAGNETISEPFEVTNIDKVKPTIANIAQDISTPTIKNVLVTADFADNVALKSKQFRIGDGAWQTYTSGAVVTENATVAFRAIDSVGNSAIVSHTVSNIDKTAPTITNIVQDVSTPTKNDVLLTAEFADNAALKFKHYRIGDDNGGAWTIYTSGAVVTENATVTFRAIDSAGNRTFVSHTVSNIDKTAPTITNVAQNVSTPTNQDVLVTAAFADNAALKFKQFRIGDGSSWKTYTSGAVVTENATVTFRAIDSAGNSTLVSHTVSNIDKTAPTITNVVQDVSTPTNQDVLVTAAFADDVALKLKQYRIGNGSWQTYTSGAVVTDNATVAFRAIDSAGNSAIVSHTVSNIDKTAPTITNIVQDISTPTNQSVLVTAAFADNAALKLKQYRIGDDGSWKAYTSGAVVSDNATITFRAIDSAGNRTVVSHTVSNIDKTAPTMTSFGGSVPDVSGLVTIALTCSEQLALLQYSWNGGTWADMNGEKLLVDENGTIAFRLVDQAGNQTLTDPYSIEAFNVQVSSIEQETTDDGGIHIDWSADGTTEWSRSYDITIVSGGTIEMDGLVTGGLEILNAPTREITLAVKPSQSDVWTDWGGTVSIQHDPLTKARLVQADSNGLAEVMFGHAAELWDINYQALHTELGMTAELDGRNRIADIYAGSDDASILLLTDDVNGDALFVDDIYSLFPEGLDAQSRIAKIDEIRAGQGNDVIDLTSQRFEYVGGGMTVRGGLGDDVIWANSGENLLFGDAGNDRVVGASGNDVIVGGAGNDVLHGGGGADTFVFGGNWGKDTVEQLATGKVTLWFKKGDESKWNASTLTYTDGANSVQVVGECTDIDLKFGSDNDAVRFAELDAMGAFDNFTSEKIFEDKNKGMLA